MISEKYKLRNSLALLCFLLALSLVQAQSIELQGTVINKSTQEGVAFAHVYIDRTSVGAISNLYGQFSLTIPNDFRSEKLHISCLGYKSKVISIDKLKKGPVRIELDEDVIQLEAVVVRSESPLGLIREALQKIPENYDTTLTRLSGYYHMSSLLGTRRIRKTESIMDVYKPKMIVDFKGKKQPGDSVYLRQMRVTKSEIKDWKLRTMLDWDNTPHQLEYRDLVKEFGFKQNRFEKFTKSYVFDIGEMVFINGRETYKISITPKKGQKKAYWNGYVFLDRESKAFVKFDLISSPALFRRLKGSFGYKVSSKLYKVKYSSGEWKESVNYKLTNGKWYLNEVNSSKYFTITSKKRNLENEALDVSVHFSVDSIESNAGIPDTIQFLPYRSEGWWDTERFMNDRYDSAFWNEFDRSKGAFLQKEPGFDNIRADGDKIAKDNIIISATVLDESTNSAIELAHISLKGTAKGTVSNELGQFDFKIPSGNLNDTLVISCLGYKNYEIATTRLLSEDITKVYLKEDAIVLKEVVIEENSNGASEIVKNAVSKVGEVYSSEDFILKGFYRDWFIINLGQDSVNASIAEAALTIYDKGYSKKGLRSMNEKIYLDEVRLLKYPGFEGNNFAFFFKQNPVKYRKMKANLAIQNVLDFPNDFDYELENVISNEDDEQLYVISVVVPDRYAKYTLYISTKDLAILRIDLTSDAPENSYIHKNPKDSSQRMKTINNTIRFRRFEGVPYLSYMRQHWTWEMVDSLGINIIESGELYTEFLANDVITDKREVSNLKSEFGKKENAIFEQDKEYNAAFWNNYNFIKSNPLNTRLENTLKQSYESVEERFIKDEEPMDRQISSYKFTKLDTLQGTLTPLRTSYDVGFYHLNVEAFPEEETLKGSSTITFNVKQNMDRLQVDLYSKMKTDKILWQGQSLHFEREYNAIFVDFPKKLIKGEQHFKIF